MILKTLSVDAQEFEQRTGWGIKPEGACKGEVCVPLPPMTGTAQVDARVLAERLSMPLLHDEVYDVWCLGPEAGGRVLSSAVLPDIVLPDLEGKPFALRELRGQKVLLVAWASW
jgi:hypothetical protein